MNFEKIDDKKKQFVEQIKTYIRELVDRNYDNSSINFPEYIENKIRYDYDYASMIFSEVEKTTIEKYFVAQKIEKVKELIIHDDLSFSEISCKLNFPSLAYMSALFKKITGLSPTEFKRSQASS
jgi:AraC-like DNA-binding protein